MTRLNRAINLMLLKHGGQIDKSGQPFIGHPMRTMAYVTLNITASGFQWGPEFDKSMLYPDREKHMAEDTQMAAVLHDVVEDTDITLESLEALFGRRVRDIVDACTRRDGETYRNYILRARENPFAKLIKIADVTDNADPRRQWNGIPRERYEMALALLQEDPLA
jgi:(p)ppGpp synthase/HD superfamily hydrolase